MIVLLAQVLNWGRYYLGVPALNNWKILMETAVVTDSVLVPILIYLFSVSSVTESQIVNSIPIQPRFSQEINDFEAVASFEKITFTFPDSHK